MYAPDCPSTSGHDENMQVRAAFKLFKNLLSFACRAVAIDPLHIFGCQSLSGKVVLDQVQRSCPTGKDDASRDQHP